MPSTSSFAPIRKAIRKFDRAALIALIGELHALNPQNRDFLAARFVSNTAALGKYKQIIREALFPDWPDEDTDVSFRDARKAISDYRKAAGYPEGIAELFVYAAECGTQLTLQYGDIDGPFYDSLDRMYAAAVKAVAALDAQNASPFIDRLRALVTKTEGIGWGLHDAMREEYRENFGNAQGTKPAEKFW